MKICLRILILLFFLVILTACAALQAEPTPTEAPPPTDTPVPTKTPLPTVNPEWPEQAKVVAEYYKAWSEKRADDALSYLAEDVRLYLGEICFSGKYARAIMRDAIKEPMAKSVLIVDNYRIDDDMVTIEIIEFSSDGNLTEVGSRSYSVSDGLIQWQVPCEPEE